MGRQGARGGRDAIGATGDGGAPEGDGGGDTGLRPWTLPAATMVQAPHKILVSASGEADVYEDIDEYIAHFIEESEV